VSIIELDNLNKFIERNAEVEHCDHRVCDLKIRPGIRKRYDRDKCGVADISCNDLTASSFVLKLGIACMLTAASPSPVIYPHYWWKGCKGTRVLPPSTIASAQDLQQSTLGRP
jgi:hypothetical protein